MEFIQAERRHSLRPALSHVGDLPEPGRTRLRRLGHCALADRCLPRSRSTARRHPHGSAEPGAGGHRDADHLPDRVGSARRVEFRGAGGACSQSTVGQSIVNVEFDWGVPIFTARQIVQERLSSLEGTFPAGIRPQLGPISSLMGQIMLVGISRQNGPNGGELAPIGKTKLMDRAAPRQGGRVTLAFWNPRRDDHGNRLRDPADWKPIKAADAESAYPCRRQADPDDDRGRCRAEGGDALAMIFRRDADHPDKYRHDDARPKSSLRTVSANASAGSL